MNKYIIALTALSLCACAHTNSTPVASASSTSDTAWKTAPAAPIDITVTAQIKSTEIEGSNSQKLSAISCSDDLDCLTKLTGYCPNGYVGGQRLVAGNDKRVGIAFHCITNQEKAAQIKQEAEWKAREAEFDAEQRAQRDAQKQINKKSTSTKK